MRHASTRPPATTPIADYGAIGDARTAALISRDGSLDWLCWPRPDSSALFAGILDPRRGGRFAIGVEAPARVHRRYVGDSNVLETTFVTADGTLRLTDLMPVGSEELKRATLRPDHEVLRIAECLEGEVPVAVLCDPRPGFGSEVPRLHRRGNLGWLYEHRANMLALRSEWPLAEQPDVPGLACRISMRAGERRATTLVFHHASPAVLPPLGAAVLDEVRRSTSWWSEWASACRYAGPYRDAVVRSALALKLLTYAPSGAVIAAPTTSLPEWIGGVRNWDYRYCWLRDASMVVRTLFDLGFTTEASAFLSWLLHATRLTWPELQVVYDVTGGDHLREREIAGLDGYAGSRPVRLGNDAHDQFQLDIYGEVVDAVFHFVQRGGTLDRATATVIEGFGRTVVKRWREPDEGIWEIRRERRHHTFSKVMCWIALDRLLQLARIERLRIPVEQIEGEARAIREEIETRGFDERLGSYVRELDGHDLDASALLLAVYGYADPRSPRMRGTFRAIRTGLARHGLIQRYAPERPPDGLPPGEGAFLLCSFWDAECLALEGDVATARATFERLLGHANDLGLFSEEIDPRTGDLLGNFPQSFTHVGLISAALAIEAAEGRALDRPHEPVAAGRVA